MNDDTFSFRLDVIVIKCGQHKGPPSHVDVGIYPLLCFHFILFYWWGKLV